MKHVILKIEFGVMGIVGIVLWGSVLLFIVFF